MDGIDRISGIAVWRQIADRIHAAIGEDRFGDGPLPAESDLARRFGVNRHTVRAAVATLVDDGILQRRRGRGTFVVERRRLSYPIGLRTRFTDALADQTATRRSRLLATAREPADADIRDALAIGGNGPVIRLETLSEADGTPISRSTLYFDADRFSGIDAAFRKEGSVTRALASFGIDDYFRATTTVSAVAANAADRADLALQPGGIVLVTRGIDVDRNRRALLMAISRFAAERIDLTV